MDIFSLLWIVSLAFTGLTEGAGLLPDGLNAAVGGKVMFTTTLTPGTPFQSVNWKFGAEELFTWNVNNFTEPEYEGRITFFMSTGSLELRNLALNDSGEYSVTILEAGKRPQTGITRLKVEAPVSNVTVTSSSTELVEFNSSVSLSCSSSGSPLSFFWLNSSSEVTGSDRVQITDGGSTLTIVNVTRYDKGAFSCRVSNPVSEGTSDPLTLIIYYGPENVNLKISPPHAPYLEGSNISLSCSAVSNPLAHYTCFLDGGLLSKGSQFNLSNSQKNQSGSYSCQAFNNKTLRYETSHPVTISVLGPPGCSAGCIAGIVISVLVVLCVVAAIVWYCFHDKKKKKKKRSAENTNTRTGGQDNGAYTRSQEMNYADVRFTKKNNGGTVQMGDQNKPSDYAEFRVNNIPRAAASSLPTYDAHLQRNKRPTPQPETAEPYAQVRKN